MKYRAEIDGLRALAVIPVIMFHAGFELFSGGFVGVDIFFAISGYLITTILINDIENKRFSIIGFYERRARRILPALFFVMFICIPFAWIWMLPAQMKDFSQSLVAVSLFTSNILFWRESGYFEATTEEKPLLHTWSLAVEEQYYIVFPILLVFIWRFGKNRAFWIIVVMATISLLLSEWGWRNKPDANFYLAPLRAWELFAGSIAAFIVHKNGVHRESLLSSLGLLAIIFSILFYDETTPFPSVYALVPVLGVVLIVLYGGQGTLVAKLLSTKVFVGIGLISYSAYLWHQPLFAFARIRLFEPNTPVFGSLALLSFVLAFLTWKYVETPFRSRRRTPFHAKGIFVFSGTGLIFFIAIGMAGHSFDGFRSRLPESVNNILLAGEPVKASCLQTDFDNCLIGDLTHPAAFALVGDSHAGRYAYAFERLGIERGFSARVISGGWCAPLMNWQVARTTLAPNANCFPAMDDAIRDLAKSEINTIVLAAQWANYAKGYRHGSAVTDYRYTGANLRNAPTLAKAFELSLIDTVSHLRRHGKAVFIIEPVPEYHFDVPNALAKAAMFGLGKDEMLLSLGSFLDRNTEFFGALDSDELDDARIIAVKHPFCNQTDCTPFDHAGLPLFTDRNHLSPLGLERVDDHLWNFIMDQ